VKLRSGLRLASGLVLVVGLSACGSGTTPPPPSPPPTTLAPFLLFDVPFPPLEADHFVFGEFSITAPGTLRATMDWTFASNVMHLYIMAGATCDGDAFVRYLDNGVATGCTLLGSDTDARTKPADFSVSVTQPGAARVFVYNLGPTSESGTVRITLAR
jgi:hypothetical protein